MWSGSSNTRKGGPVEASCGNNRLECASLMLRNSESPRNYMALAQLPSSKQSFSCRWLVRNKTAHYAQGKEVHTAIGSGTVKAVCSLWWCPDEFAMVCFSKYWLHLWVYISNTGLPFQSEQSWQDTAGTLWRHFLLPSRRRQGRGAAHLAEGQALVLTSCCALWKPVSHLWVWNKITYAVAFSIVINSVYIQGISIKVHIAKRWRRKVYICVMSEK